jgi:hypothetical protein
VEKCGRARQATDSVEKCGRAGQVTDSVEKCGGARQATDSVEKCGGARQATNDNIRSMHIPCWITKAKDIHSEYIMLIALPSQQWLRERASTLRLYVHCLSFTK